MNSDHGTAEDIVARYLAALEAYLRGEGEAALADGWTVARWALERGMGVVALAEAHRQALTALEPLTSAQAQSAHAFFSESLAPLEMTLRGYREALETVRARNDELERTSTLLRTSFATIEAQRDALLRAERQREELAALLVHDLKNPLVAVIANVEFVLREPGLDREAQEALQDSKAAAEALRRMVADLLDIHRGDEGRLHARRSPVDAAAILDEVWRSVAPAAMARSQTLTVCGERPCSGDLDADLLRRLLQNLLDNAVKFTPSGGKISAKLECVQDAIVLEVCDTGPGIPPENRGTIFDKFVQVDTTRRDSHGLGLVFCRMAAQAHGGEIWVEDGEAGGSCFHVRLPLSREGS